MEPINTIDDLYSKDAEDNIIAICLVDDTKVTNILASLRSFDFYQRSHQFIFKAIENLHKQGKPTDIVSVSELLKFNGELSSIGGRKTVNELAMNYITSKNWEQLTKVIIKFSKLRTLMSLCRDSISRLEKFYKNEYKSRVITLVSQLKQIGGGGHGKENTDETVPGLPRDEAQEGADPGGQVPAGGDQSGLSRESAGPRGVCLPRSPVPEKGH